MSKEIPLPIPRWGQFCNGLHIRFTFRQGVLRLNERAVQPNEQGKGRLWELHKETSFEVNQGEIVGLLGPNGAGKTTSFYTVVGLIRPAQSPWLF